MLVLMHCQHEFSATPNGHRATVLVHKPFGSSMRASHLIGAWNLHLTSKQSLRLRNAHESTREHMHNSQTNQKAPQLNQFQPPVLRPCGATALSKTMLLFAI